MKVVKGEMFKLKDTDKLKEYEIFEHYRSVHTGAFVEIVVLHCCQYGQTDEREYHTSS